MSAPSRRRAALLALMLLAGACSAEAGEASAGGAAGAAPPQPAPTQTAPPARPRVATAPDNGFGSAIAWRGLDEGLAEAAADGRPLMLLVHASWCKVCKALKPAFFDPALVKASEALVMVNVDQDEDPRTIRYSTDGTYVPRVMFLAPDGSIDRELQNPTRTRYHHFFSPEDDLVGAMELAVARHARK